MEKSGKSQLESFQFEINLVGQTLYILRRYNLCNETKTKCSHQWNTHQRKMGVIIGEQITLLLLIIR